MKNTLTPKQPLPVAESPSFQVPPRERQSLAAAMKQAHQSLAADLLHLEEAVRDGAAKDLAALRGCLAATYTHVCAHFHAEEHRGYMVEVRTREPRFEGAIQQLADEHKQLRQSLDDLLGQVRVANDWSDTLRTKVRDWLHRLHHHEAKETALVQNAFNSDLDAED